MWGGGGDAVIDLAGEGRRRGWLGVGILGGYRLSCSGPRLLHKHGHGFGPSQDSPRVSPRTWPVGVLSRFACLSTLSAMPIDVGASVQPTASAA